MKITAQIQQNDFICVLADGEVMVQTENLKGIGEPEWKETLQTHQLGEKLQCTLSDMKESSYETTTDKKPAFVSSAAHRTTCLKAHWSAAVA